MTATGWFTAATTWLVILALAIVNGALREKVFVPRWGVPVACAVSGVLLSAPWLAAKLRGYT